jgi:multimeric flavodoxin WrbA
MTYSESTPPVRILALSGSERAGGNTEQVLDYASGLVGQYGAELTTLKLREYDIAPCSGCGGCNSRSAPCVVDDDAPMVVNRMIEADALIYATPVHGFGPAHLMQIFIERAGVGYLRFHRPLANKVGGAIVISRRYSDMHVHQQLVLNMLLNRMIVPGSGFPAILRGGAADRALDDAEGVEALDRMVERMVGMARLLKSSSPDALRLIRCSDENERRARPLEILR